MFYVALVLLIAGMLAFGLAFSAPVLPGLVFIGGLLLVCIALGIALHTPGATRTDTWKG